MKTPETTSEDDILLLEDGDITLLDDDSESLDHEIISSHTIEIDSGTIRDIEGLQEVSKKVEEIFKTIERIEALEDVEKEGLSFQLASHAAVEVDLLIFRLGVRLREISQKLLSSEQRLKKQQEPSANKVKRKEEVAKNLRKVSGIWDLESIKNAEGERIGIRARLKGGGLFSLTPKEISESNLIPFPEVKSKAIKKRAAGEK